MADKFKYNALTKRLDLVGSGVDSAESTVNKTNDVAGNSTSVLKYTSAKGVYDFVIAAIGGISVPVTSVFSRTGVITAQNGDYDTSQVTENTNLYFTTARVNTQVAAYTGDVTLTGTVFSIGAAKVTNAMLEGSIDLTTKVTGLLPDANISSASTWNNQVVYETWNTNANYTTVNTTAKRLIVLQTGTLTATRTLTLSNVTGAGQEVIIVAGGSVTSTNKISVTCGYKINNTLNSFDIVGNYSQTLLTSVNSGSWTTGQATPQFVETSTALTSPKIVRGVSVGIGNTRTWTTAGMGAGTAYGDIILTSAGILATGASGETSAVQMITPYDPSYGWTIYQTANTFLNYWGYGIIQAGTKPLEYTTNSVNAFYWGATYSLEHYSSDGSNSQPFRAIIYINDTGVPSILETLQSDGVTFYSVSAGKLLLSATSNRGYTTVKKIATRSITQLPERYQKWSANAQTQYWTGTDGLGIGHTSQNASAIFHVVSTTKGSIHSPSMNTAQVTSSCTVEALHAWDATLHKLAVHDGSALKYYAFTSDITPDSILAEFRRQVLVELGLTYYIGIGTGTNTGPTDIFPLKVDGAYTTCKLTGHWSAGASYSSCTMQLQESSDGTTGGTWTDKGSAITVNHAVDGPGTSGTITGLSTAGKFYRIKVVISSGASINDMTVAQTVFS